MKPMHLLLMNQKQQKQHKQWKWQTGTQARHQSQPSAISDTPATQSDGRCRQVPRRPRKVTIYFAKCHTCHANGGGAHGAKREPGAPPEPA